MGIVSADDFVAQSFDYLIVGGGTAGLAVAVRLSEDSDIKVGVIEAGAANIDDAMILTPGLSPQTWADPRYDWMFETTPQKHANDQVVKQPRGRILGGSSAINLMMWSQTTRRDLDNWQRLGNPHWDWDSLFPYYRKAETFHEPNEAARNFFKAESEYLDPSLRGTNGPVQISFPDEDNFVSKVWAETCRNAGLKASLADPRLGSSLGGFNQLKCVDPRTGRRSYSVTAYLEPNIDRQNLFVLTGAIADKVDLEKGADGYTATGVAFTCEQTQYRATASKEVILSCGAFQSPQVLELSGIGSAKLLEKHDIEVKIDNPNVGENLQEHVIAVNALEISDPELTKPSLPSFMTTANVSLKDICAAGESIDLDKKGEDESRREEQYSLQRGSTVASDQAVASYLGTVYGPMFIIAVNLSNPYSRGSVHIQSANASTAPSIDPQYYSHPLDIDIMSRALLRSRDVASSEPLSSYLKDGGKQPDATLDTLARHAKGRVSTQFHPVGTCAMVPREKGGVVSSKLVVHGTTNLRVVDASIFPMHVQGNTLSLVYAVAEKAADMIKADQK